MCFRRTSHVCVAVFFSAFALAHARPAIAATVKIADSTQGYTNFSLPAMNDNGLVAFNATKDGSAKVFTGSGGPVNSFDPSTLGSYLLYSDPSINNAGHVGFLVDSSDFIGYHTGAYRWDGGSSATTTLDPNSHGGIHYFHPIVTMSRGSDDVYVAYSEEFAQGRILTQSGLILLGARYQQGRPVVSSNGMLIVTEASHSTGPIDGFLISNPNNVNWSNGVTIEGNPYAIQPGLETGVFFSSYGSSIGINAAGTIVLSSPTYSANNEPISSGTFEIDATGHGKWLSVGAGLALAINDRGTILPFTPFSIDDLGSPIVSLDYIPDGFNNNDLLAFRATLANGTSGIWVTTVPEPAALGMIALPLAALVASRRCRARGEV